MALHWDQRSCQLICAGDSKVIKIWDIETETKVTALSTGVNASVTNLSMQLKGKFSTEQLIKIKSHQKRNCSLSVPLNIN